MNKSGGYRAAHHGNPDLPAGEEGVLVNVYTALVNQIFIGIHMAGPNLTPDTFAQAMYKYPRTGGIPGAPLLYWTRQYPNAVKDFVEVWFDSDRQGPDERGDRGGSGMMVKVDGAKRYQPGQWPRTEPTRVRRERQGAHGLRQPAGRWFVQARRGRPHAQRSLQDLRGLQDEPLERDISVLALR